MRDLPPTAYVSTALAALCLAVRERPRIRAGDGRARAWFIVFLGSAAVCTVIAIDMLLTPHPR